MRQSGQSVPEATGSRPTCIVQAKVKVFASDLLFISSVVFLVLAPTVASDFGKTLGIPSSQLWILLEPSALAVDTLTGLAQFCPSTWQVGSVALKRAEKRF